MAENDGFYYCNCSKYCKRRKKVSSSTWYAHGQYRGSDTTNFRDFEAAASAGAPSARQHEIPQDTHARPLRKRQRDDVDDAGVPLDNQNGVNIYNGI